MNWINVDDTTIMIEKITHIKDGAKKGCTIGLGNERIVCDDNSREDILSMIRQTLSEPKLELEILPYTELLKATTELVDSLSMMEHSVSKVTFTSEVYDALYKTKGLLEASDGRPIKTCNVSPDSFDDIIHKTYTPNWKPQVGEWVYDMRENHLATIRKIINRGPINYLKAVIGYMDKACRYGFDDEIRPAVLDDFACEIPDYGKVWFVEDNKYTRMCGGYEIACLITSNEIWQWQIKALIAHYNITVMDEATWKKFSEVKDAL